MRPVSSLNDKGVLNTLNDGISPFEYSYTCDRIDEGPKKCSKKIMITLYGSYGISSTSPIHY